MKKSILIAVLLVLMCNGFATLAAEPDKGEDNSTRGLPFEEHYQHSLFTLENGLRTLVHEDPTAAGVTVAVYVHVGSKDEPQGKSGFAHLFEHLLFNGTETNPGEYFKYLDEIGATDANGSTSNDYTNYYETVPREALERALWLEADRMANVGKQATLQSLKTQIDVVKNEKNLSDNQSFGRAEYKYLQTMYPAGHPYSHSIIGSVEDLESATLDDVKNWYAKYYGAQNTFLALSGNVTLDDAKVLIEKYFGHLEPGPSLDKIRSYPIKRSQNTMQYSYDISSTSNLIRSYPLPKVDSKQVSLATQAMEIFASGENSILHRELVNEKKLAMDVEVYTERKELDTTVHLSITPKEGVELGELAQTLESVIAGYLKTGPTQGDIERYIGGYRSYIFSELESAYSRGLSMIEGYVLFDDPLYSLQLLAWAESATPKELRSAARSAFEQGYHEQRQIAQPERVAAKPQVNLATKPTIAQQAPVEVPKPDVFTLQNGLRVVHLQRASAPQVLMSYRVRQGTNNLLPKEQDGLTIMAGVMLKEGVPGFSEEGLLDQLEKHSISLDVDVQSDSVSLDLAVANSDFQRGLKIWSDLLTQAQFKKHTVKKLVDETLEEIKVQVADTESFARDYLFPRIYDGKKNTLSYSEQVRFLNAIKPAQLESLHSELFRPDGASLYVVGNISKQELESSLSDSLAGWQGVVTKGSVAQREYPAAPKKPKFILVNDEGANQTSLSLSMRIPSLYGRDNAVDELANAIVGGGFTSRLNMNLREDKGWTYGIYSELQTDKLSTSVGLQGSVTGANTVDAVKEISTELEGLVDSRPITEVELNEIRTSDTKSFPSRLSSSRSLLGLYQDTDDLLKPYQYIDGYVQRLNDVDIDQVNEKAAVLFRSSQPVWLLIGDLSTFEEQLRQAKLGDIEVYDLRGERLR